MMPNIILSSRTTTITETAAPTYTLKLKPKVGTFLQDMVESNLFSIEQKKEISSLMESLTTNDAPMFLSLFLSEILQPALLESEDVDMQEKLCKIEDMARNILISLLPEGTDVDEYIIENAIQADEAADFMNACLRTDNFFQKKEGMICQLADQCNENIENAYENLKKRLNKLIELKDSSSLDSKSRQQAIDNMIIQISNQMEINAQQKKTLGEKIQEVQKNYQQLLQECHDLLSNCKRS